MINQVFFLLILYTFYGRDAIFCFLLSGGMKRGNVEAAFAFVQNKLWNIQGICGMMCYI